MPRVTFRAHDGQETVLDVPLGYNLMEAAVGANLSGIVGECGGAMMCATCHVQVDPDRLDDLPPMGPTEDAMLDSAICPRQSNSRLGCQLVADAGFEGLVVTMPARQR